MFVSIKENIVYSSMTLFVLSSRIPSVEQGLQNKKCVEHYPQINNLNFDKWVIAKQK